MLSDKVIHKIDCGKHPTLLHYCRLHELLLHRQFQVTTVAGFFPIEKSTTILTSSTQPGSLTGCIYRDRGAMDIPVTICLWSSIVAVPLVLTTNDLYKHVFPTSWYDQGSRDVWNSTDYPSPLGLSIGILAVIIGQIFVLIYFWARRAGYLGAITSIQRNEGPIYDFKEELIKHLSQPEGLVMLGGYLIGTWMFGLMPASYYSFSGGINWSHVACQLLLQDGIQYLMHLVEHKLDARLYKASHKPHHRFTNPKMFDAFNGSATGTDISHQSMCIACQQN